MCESWQRTIWQCLWNLFLVPSGDRWTSYARLQFEVCKMRLIGMRGGNQGVGALDAWLRCGAQAQARITVLCFFARKFNFKVLLSTWAVDFFKHFIKKEKKNITLLTGDTSCKGQGIISYISYNTIQGYWKCN